MPDQPHSFDLTRAARQTLQSLRRAGVSHLRKARAPAPAPADDQRLAAPPGALEQTLLAPTSPIAEPATKPQQDRETVSVEQRGQALNLVAQQVAACTRCRELAQTRTQTVFGVGNPQARLCFLGEAPGADEDRQGEPFVGRAGQLLTRIIEACTLQREDVYIMNILKCRPPGNRTPSSIEADNCQEYLLRQLEIIHPEFICCLGGVAAQNLLQTNQSIGRLRGRMHLFRGIKVLATYHPAYLLRNPSAKRPVWEDMQLLMQEMGIQLPENL